MSKTMDRIWQEIAEGKRRCHYDNLTLDNQTAIETAFADHPEWSEVWLFHDGKVRGENWPSSLTSRAACLLSIATDGFPVPISRAGYNRWMEIRKKNS